MKMAGLTLFKKLKPMKLETAAREKVSLALKPKFET